LNTKKNTYNASGAFRYSYVNDNLSLIKKNGVSTNLYLAETSGKYRYSINGEYVSKDYDNNDLGINFQTNYHTLSGNVNYRTLNPTKKLNSFRVGLNMYAQFNNDSNYLQEQSVNLNMNLTTKKNHAAGVNLSGRLFDVYDYYDSRVAGRYTVYPKYYNSSAWISSNYNNKFALM